MIETKSGLRVIEMVTNRDENAKEHRDLWKYVSQEILEIDTRWKTNVCFD